METSMKVTVRLFGTLSQKFPGYRPSQGVEIEIPDGSTVKELLAHLEISEERGAAVIANGKVLNVDVKVEAGSSLDIFQSISGG
jgi:sulfur carrier protein ThiS